MNSMEASHQKMSERLAALAPTHLEAVKGLLEGWLAEPKQSTLPVSDKDAQSVVNEWILQVLPDRFVAIEPRLIAGGDIWSVSVGLAYPHIGIVGEVGEVLVSAFSGGIISATHPDTMKSAGIERYKEKEDEIQAAFLSAGNT